MDQGIKSRPRYARLEIDPSGRRHLLLTEQSVVPHESLAPDCTMAAFCERWTIARHSRAIPGVGAHQTDQAFRSQQHLIIALKRRLAEERMGLRLYAAGTEPFLWTVAGVAAEGGLGCDEMRLFALGNSARRIFCNHCRTITEYVTTNIVACAGCGAQLFVRDHFSRRLNAFAGVQVDAEVPGDVPAIEEIYR